MEGVNKVMVEAGFDLGAFVQRYEVPTIIFIIVAGYFMRAEFLKKFEELKTDFHETFKHFEKVIEKVESKQDERSRLFHEKFEKHEEALEKHSERLVRAETDIEYIAGNRFKIKGDK